jgi:V-ATPase subunit H
MITAGPVRIGVKAPVEEIVRLCHLGSSVMFSLSTGCLVRNLKFRQSATASTSSSSSTSVQHLYELTFCLWLLSYDCAASDKVRNHFHRCGSVSALVDLVVAAPREKVVRLAISTLCNLATCDGRDDRENRRSSLLLSGRAAKSDAAVFLNDMVGCGLLKPIEMLADRESSDPEFSHGTPGENECNCFVVPSHDVLITPLRPSRSGAPATSASRNVPRDDALGRVRCGSQVGAPEMGHRSHRKVLQGECSTNGREGWKL